MYYRVKSLLWNGTNNIVTLVVSLSKHTSLVWPCSPSFVSLQGLMIDATWTGRSFYNSSQRINKSFNLISMFQKNTFYNLRSCQREFLLRSEVGKSADGGWWEILVRLGGDSRRPELKIQERKKWSNDESMCFLRRMVMVVVAYQRGVCGSWRLEGGLLCVVVDEERRRWTVPAPPIFRFLFPSLVNRGSFWVYWEKIGLLSIVYRGLASFIIFSFSIFPAERVIEESRVVQEKRGSLFLFFSFCFFSNFVKDRMSGEIWLRELLVYLDSSRERILSASCNVWVVSLQKESNAQICFVLKTIVIIYY